jgi:hypothetical protein
MEQRFSTRDEGINQTCTNRTNEPTICNEKSRICSEDGTIGILLEAGNAASSVGGESSTNSKSSEERESFESAEEDGIGLVTGTDDEDDDDLERLKRLEVELERLASSVQDIQDEVVSLDMSFECWSGDGIIGTATDDIMTIALYRTY